MIHSAAVELVMQSQTIASSSAMPKPAFSVCCMLNTSGLPVTSPWSLAKATSEPVKVMAPIATPSAISTRLPTRMSPGTPMP